MRLADRRTSVRFEILGELWGSLERGAGGDDARPASVAARLLDISTDGVLLGCPDTSRLGEIARVTARVSGRPLEADIEIRHVSSDFDRRAGGYRVGGRFLALEAGSRQAIDGMLKGSSQ
jgi:hypothetical protein